MAELRHTQLPSNTGLMPGMVAGKVYISSHRCAVSIIRAIWFPSGEAFIHLLHLTKKTLQMYNDIPLREIVSRVAGLGFLAASLFIKQSDIAIMQITGGWEPGKHKDYRGKSRAPNAHSKPFVASAELTQGSGH